MERSVDVATGESVAFTYELAGLGSRFVAMFVDFVAQLTLTLTLILIFAWIGSSAPAAHRVEHSVSKIAGAILAALAYAAIFVIYFGYFILFEWLWNGRTPGKRALGIRVVRDAGFPVDLVSATIRNVVRILEFALGFYAISAVVVLLSARNQRLGDMVAGTIVVRDNRYERTAASLAAEIERDDPLVRELTPADRDLVRRYCERRPSLGLEARTAVSARIAARIRPKLAVPFDHIDDDHLLVHLATTAL